MQVLHKMTRQQLKHNKRIIYQYLAFV